MRIRQVKPAFWTDPRVAALPPAARLFYIGLWMEADDAGWLRWDVPQIANELYGYESRRRRERDVESYMALLVDAGRVVIHPCGHVEIPTMTNHQHLSVQSKQVKTFWREHAGCIDSPANTRGDPPTPVETRASPAVKVKVNVKGKGNGDGKVNVNGKGSAPAKAPDGAGAMTNEENLEPFLRVVNES